MKTIGLIGGLSWESTTEYYKLINQGVQKALGGVHSAKIVLYSLDFAEIKQLQHDGCWEELTQRMAMAGQALQRAGADFLLICSNTMHLMASEVAQGAGLPLLHIADPTGQAVLEAGIKKIALIGTRFTMEEAFYKGRLTEKFGLEVIVPPDSDREIIHSVIYNELVRGIISETSRQAYLEVITRLKEAGAEGVILGCTEIMLLISAEISPLPVFDTTTLHAEAAITESLVGA